LAVLQTHYEVLGLAEDADNDAIKAAWKKAARETHPDVNQSDPKAAERFQRAKEAYDVLSDTVARERYDRRRKGGDAPFRGSFVEDDDDEDLADEVNRSPRAAPEPDPFSRTRPGSGSSARSGTRWRHEPPPPHPDLDPFVAREEEMRRERYTRYAEPSPDPFFDEQPYEAPYRSPTTSPWEEHVVRGIERDRFEEALGAQGQFTATGTRHDGRAARNPFRSKFRNGGRLP